LSAVDQLMNTSPAQTKSSTLAMPLSRNLFVFSMPDVLLRGTSGENAPKSPWRQFGHATVRCSPSMAGLG
jgi:hypothetical protein